MFFTDRMHFCHPTNSEGKITALNPHLLELEHSTSTKGLMREGRLDLVHVQRLHTTNTQPHS